MGMLDQAESTLYLHCLWDEDEWTYCVTTGPLCPGRDMFVPFPDMAMELGRRVDSAGHTTITTKNWQIQLVEY